MKRLILCACVFIGCSKEKPMITDYEYYSLEISPSFSSAITITIHKQFWEKEYTGEVDTVQIDQETTDTGLVAESQAYKKVTTSFVVDTVALHRIDKIIHLNDFKALVWKDSVLGLDGAGWQIGYRKKGYTQYFDWWSPDCETKKRGLEPVMELSKEMVKMTGDILKKHEYYQEIFPEKKKIETGK